MNPLGPCWIARTLSLADPCDYAPRYRPDLAHIGLSENWLSKAALGPQLSKEEANDPRLLVDACRRHHHRLDTGFLKLRRSHLPQSVVEFANEHGVSYRLDQLFGPPTDEGGRSDLGEDRSSYTAGRTSDLAPAQNVERGAGGEAS